MLHARCAVEGAAWGRRVKTVSNTLVLIVAFRVQQDHTKLAIVPEDNVLCIGDINRQSTQFARYVPH
jgi:hypothetical protein